MPGAALPQPLPLPLPLAVPSPAGQLSPYALKAARGVPEDPRRGPQRAQDSVCPPPGGEGRAGMRGWDEQGASGLPTGARRHGHGTGGGFVPGCGMANKGCRLGAAVALRWKSIQRNLRAFHPEDGADAALVLEFLRENFLGAFPRVIGLTSNCSNPQLYL